MKKSIFSVVLVALVVFWTVGPLQSVLAGTYSGGGNGTAEKPYRISTAADMNEIGAHPNDWGSHFVMVNDVNLAQFTGTQFNTIGYWKNTSNKPFAGVFDGNGFSIYNFTYDKSSVYYVALFGYVDDPNAEIKNTILVEPNVHSAWGQYIGSLVGYLKRGTITNCQVEGGSIFAAQYVGGLVGRNQGTIFDCSATNTVSGGDKIGGLVGHNGASAQISNCHALSSVSASGHYAGGLVGWNSFGTILNSCAVGSVNGSSNTGGLVAYSHHGQISYCYAASSVSGDDHVGGLVGWNSHSEISNCYAAGSVLGDESVGGIVGLNLLSTISNCYATGAVDGNNNTGGIVGQNSSSSIVTESFWDIETTNQETSAGGTGAVGKTTAEMMTRSTFTNAGWDFTTPIWKICEDNDYPRLEWEMIHWPVIDEEPEVTLGTSNTISWQQVYEANEYYVICCSDANLENVVGESGWADVNEYTFEGLEIGFEYWYVVKARQNCVLESEWSDVVSSLQVTLSDAVDIMLDADSLKNSNMKNALGNKIDESLEMIDEGLYKDALKKLENDILKKTNGCAETGEPDKNDWIESCEEQEQIYPFIIETIDYVRSLME